MNTNTGENSASSFRIADYQIGISFSFGLGVSLVVLVFMLLLFGVTGFLFTQNESKSLSEYAEKRDRQVVDTVYSLVRSVSASDKGMVQLSREFSSLVEKHDPANGKIHEVFVLSRAGRVLAHNDFTVIGRKNDPVTEISSRYSREEFHKALNLEEGQTLVQDWPFALPAGAAEFSPVAGILFPEKKQWVSVYSTPYYVNGKVLGTVHVVLENNLLPETTDRMVRSLGLLLAIAVALSVVLSVVLLLLVSSRLSQVQRTWVQMVRYKLENDMVKESYRKDISSIHQKLVDLEGGKGGLPPLAKKQQKALDAILVEEEGQ